MSIKTNLNIAPYFDDYDITKKYYRILFKPGFAVQARELNQLQTTLQNQIEQFGENIYKEGSIIKGSTFTELRNLKYVKVIDRITPSVATTPATFTIPEDFVERTVVDDDGVIDEYYYEIEDQFGLKALIIQGTTGFQSRAPDLNTFYVVYLNTVGTDEKKAYSTGDSLSIKEYILRTDAEGNETTIDNGIVATTTVSPPPTPIGNSFGLNVSEGIIFQRGHFLFVDDQTIVVEKYLDNGGVIKPNNISVGYIVDESIISSQQDSSLLDNANGAPNENAPGADRLVLVPRLVARDTTEAEADSDFFILRRYENGEAVETRDVAQFNSIARELARRTHETNGDYTNKEFKFEVTKQSLSNTFILEMGEGVAYAKGYRISNDTKRFFTIADVTESERADNQAINFNYGGYCNIVSANNVINSNGRVSIDTFQNVSLRDSSNTVIGSAVVKNYTADKLYLFAIRMDANTSFANVDNVAQGANGSIEIVPKIINSTESTLVFDFNRPFVKSVEDISFSIRQNEVATTAASGIITITPDVDAVFDTNSSRDLLVINNSTNLPVTVSSTSIDLDGKLVIDTVLTSGVGVTVYYNMRLSNPTPKIKNVFDVYVKTEYDIAKSKYTLGLPDCIKILSIVDTANTDFTNSFKLIKNQKDDFYDHSYIEKIPGSATPADEEELLIKVKVFRVDTDSELNFFTVNSYNNIDIRDIPYFESTNGAVHNLKNCVDFRPYRLPISAYSTTEGGATVLSVQDVELPVYTDQLFSGTINYATPSVNTSGTLDIEYYKSRTDYIVGSSYGRFKYITGDEINNSLGRIDTNENTIIAEIKVPGFPLLTKEEAYVLNRQKEAISVSRKTVKTYTMKDIDGLSKKIDRLEYYTALSLLEKSATDLVIQDENGLNRFKNGIIVDNFDNLLVADTSDPTFNASVDFAENTMNPSIIQFPLSLKVNSFDGTQSYDGKNSTATLSSNSLVKFISQQYATNFKACTSSLFNYKGVGFLTPDYDVAYDTVANPINFDSNVNVFTNYTESLSEFANLTSSQLNVLNYFNLMQGSNSMMSTDTITNQNYDTMYRDFSSSTTLANEQLVGDFLTNTSLKPYIKAREIQVELYGLRPNTRHYFFFDQKDINTNAAPGLFVGNEATENRVVQAGTFGSDVRSNSNGALVAIIRIPSNTFFVGEREIVVADTPVFEDISDTTSSLGVLKFNAYNFSSADMGLTMSTRHPDIDAIETKTNRSVTTREVTALAKYNLPIAQTFFVKENMTQGADSLYLGKVDLYFKRKSLTNGITVMIREVENGYPSWETLPFAKKHLRASDIAVSDDGTDATSFIFSSAIRLDSEKEYAIIVQPDADDPDYQVFIQKTGGIDLSTGSSVSADWGDGALFASTNNRAWISYQDEDMKFDLYRYNFNLNTGTVELQTREAEFFTIDSVVGSFIDGELVYAFKEDANTTYTISANTATRSITGSGLTNYSVGDYLYIETGGGSQRDLLRVATVTSSTAITVERPPLFSGSYASRPVVAGKAVYFNSRKPSYMVLENSSARASRNFVATDTLFGIRSNATAEIVSVDNQELSYMQAMINRIDDADTNVKIALRAVDPVNTNNTPYISNFNFANNKSFAERGCVIFSRSNDTTSAKNLKLILTLEKDNIQTTTPLVDLETAKIFAYVYNITNSEATTSRYISKKVELKEGFDAEDFRLYTSAYRPIGSDIKVYIKIKNSDDPVSLRNNPWIELEKIENDSAFSSISNPGDFKEYVFGVPESAKVDNILTYANETGNYSSYRSFAVRIDLLADNIARSPKILDYRGVAFE